MMHVDDATVSTDYSCTVMVRSKRVAAVRVPATYLLVDVRLKEGGSDPTCRPGVWGRAPAGARGSAPTGCGAVLREENLDHLYLISAAIFIIQK